MNESRVAKAELEEKLYDPDYIEDPPGELNKLRKKVEDLNSRGLLLLLLSVEWYIGLLIYFGVRDLIKYSDLVAKGKREKKAASEIKKTEKEKGILSDCIENINSILETGVKIGHSRDGRWLMVFMIAMLLGAVIFFFVLAETSFGEESERHGTLYGIGWDVTGSTERDARLNEKLILDIIGQLDAGDEILIINITQNSFSEPEYLIEKSMPNVRGSFRKDIRNATSLLKKEFRNKLQNLDLERPRTSLIEGIFLLGTLCQEKRQNKETVLFILISDMLENSEIKLENIMTDAEQSVMKLKADGIIPNLRGLNIYCLGVSSSNIKVRHWVAIKTFWENYFTVSGGCLKAYSISRSLPKKELPKKR